MPTRKSVNVIEISRHIAKTLWDASQDPADPVYACDIKAVQIVGDENLTDDTFRSLLPMAVVDFMGFEGRRVAEVGIKTFRGTGIWRIGYFYMLEDLEDQGPNLQIRLNHIFDLWNQSKEWNAANNGGKYLPGWGSAQVATHGVSVFNAEATEMKPLEPLDIQADGAVENGYVDVAIDLEVMY